MKQRFLEHEYNFSECKAQHSLLSISTFNYISQGWKLWLMTLFFTFFCNVNVFGQTNNCVIINSITPSSVCVGSPVTINTCADATQVEWQLNGITVSTNVNLDTILGTSGTTVAGGNGAGSGADQLYQAIGLFVDAGGNVYVSDSYNNRIQKWTPGAISGITVAGGNGAGNAADQLSNPKGVFVDAGGNMYISDWDNNRIQKWAPGAASGITVAGGNGPGSLADQLSGPYGVFVDAGGNVFVSDYYNARIQKWAPGATSGTTIAGVNGYGSAADQLASPNGVFVDAGGNVYVSDYGNHRIQKWAPGATLGTTVAGGNGAGSAANQLDRPSGVFVDAGGNVYVSDYYNNRIQKWAPGASSGTTVSGGNGPGSAANQLFRANGVFVDASGNIYVSDYFNNRIQKWAFTKSATYNPLAGGSLTAVVSGTCSITSTAVTVNVPTGTIIHSITPDSLCIGSSVTISIIGNATQVEWQLNGITVSTNTNLDTVPGTSANFTPVAGGSLIAIVSNGIGTCSITSTAVTVNVPTDSTINISICPGSSYTFNGQILTDAGTYYDALVNGSGCDSIITLNLTYLTINSITPSSVCVGSPVTINTSADATQVQWQLNGITVSTNTNLDTFPETSATYIPMAGGILTAAVSNGTCSITSTAVRVVVPTSPVNDNDPCTIDACDPNTGLTTYTPSGLAATATAGTILCYNGTTTVQLCATGGVAPYISYDIDDTLFTSCRNLTSGAGSGFTYAVFDAAGCQVQTSPIDIVNPLKLEVSCSATQTYGSGNTGSVSVSAIGGTGGYSYYWYYIESCCTVDTDGICLDCPITVDTSATISGLGTGIYYVRVTDANGCGANCWSEVTNSCDTPSVPGPINGTNPICSKQCNTYSIAAVPGATSYTWILPAGATGSSTGTSITVCFSSKFSNNGSFICVRANSPCSNSTYTCISIKKAKDKPSKPNVITGNNFVCTTSANTQTYCVVKDPNVSNYNWTIAGNASPSMSIVSGQGTYCVTVLVPLGYPGNQKLKVTPSNCKGTGDYRSIDIKKTTTPPAAPGVINGYSSVCMSKKDASYEISTISNASSYNWNVTCGATIVEGQGTKKIKVDFRTATCSSLTICVTAINGCGSSAPSCKTVAVNLYCKTNMNDTDVDSEISSLIVYPNPTPGKATIVFNLRTDAKYVMKVVDLIGRVMICETINAVVGFNTADINLENVAKGLYLVSVQTEGAEAQRVNLIVE